MFTGPATLLIVLFNLCLAYLRFLMWIEQVLNTSMLFISMALLSSGVPKQHGRWHMLTHADTICPLVDGIASLWTRYNAGPVSYPQSQKLRRAERKTNYIEALVSLVLVQKNTCCLAWTLTPDPTSEITLFEQENTFMLSGWLLCASQVCLSVHAVIFW